VLDEEGLILLPFMSCGTGDYWRCLGGVQLVTSRPTRSPRAATCSTRVHPRAFMANERLMTLSDERLQVLSLATATRAVRTADLPLARNVTQFSVVGSYGVQLVATGTRGPRPS